MALHNHGNLLERSVSGTLADTVDGHLHLTSPVEHTADGVGGRHAEVVVTVCGEDGAVEAVDMLHEVLDLFTILARQTVARRVGDVDHRSTCLDDRLHHPGEVFVLRPSGILGIELHIVDETACILHGSHRTLDDFFPVGVELVTDV